MKKEKKVVVAKIIIILMVLLFIIMAFFSYLNFDEIDFTPSYDLYEKIIFGSLIINLILTVILCNINIVSEKSKSKKYKIRIDNFVELKNQIFSKLEIDGYTKEEIFKNDLYEIYYTFKRNIMSTDIVLMLKLDELTEEIYNDYKETYFEDFGNYLIKEKKIKTKELNVIFIICVNKVTKYFSKYTESNVQQYYKKYNLPIGVSLASKTLYIGVQKDGYAKLKYQKILKKFNNYIEDIRIGEFK